MALFEFVPVALTAALKPLRHITRVVLRFLVQIAFAFTPDQVPASARRSKLCKSSRAFLAALDLLQSQPVYSKNWLRFKIALGSAIQSEVLNVIRKPVSISSTLSGVWYEPTPRGSKLAPISSQVILYVHGGGFVSGSVFSHDGAVAMLSDVCAARSFSVEYNLSPDNKWPAILAEVKQAYEWLINECKIPADSIFLCGDSAGGNLVMSLFWQYPSLSRPGGIIAISPVLELDGSFRRGTEPTYDPMLTRWMMDAMNPLMGLSNEELASYSIFNAKELKALPDTLLLISDSEALYQENVIFKKKFSAAPIDFRVFSQLPHAFTLAYEYIPEAFEALYAIRDWMKRDRRM